MLILQYRVGNLLAYVPTAVSNSYNASSDLFRYFMKVYFISVLYLILFLENQYILYLQVHIALPSVIFPSNRTYISEILIQWLTEPSAYYL